MKEKRRIERKRNEGIKEKKKWKKEKEREESRNEK